LHCCCAGGSSASTTPSFAFPSLRAAVRQPASADCRAAARGGLSGSDYTIFYTLLAAVRQPAPAGGITAALEGACLLRLHHLLHSTGRRPAAGSCRLLDCCVWGALRLRRHHRLNVTCVQCENGKSISPVDSAQQTMAHDADTDSDLARPLDGKHPSARNATPAMILRSATRRRTAGQAVAHQVPVTRSETTVERWMGAELLGRLGDRGGAGRRRSGPNWRRAGAGGPGGGSGPTTSIRNAGGAFTNRMTAETLGVRADIACVFYICIWAVTTTRSGIDSFWINQISKMSLNRRFKRRIKG
jgi:hypothetical protein